MTALEWLDTQLDVVWALLWSTFVLVCILEKGMGGLHGWDLVEGRPWRPVGLSDLQ